MFRTRIIMALGLTLCSGIAAQAQLISQKRLPTPLANEAAMAALSACSAMGFHASVTVVDRYGDTRVQLFGDGARAASADLSRRKAYTSVVRGISSGEYGKWLAGRPAPVPGGIQPDPNLFGAGGAFPLTIGDDIVAAIGVSGDGGAAKDEDCANAGIAKIKARLK